MKRINYLILWLFVCFFQISNAQDTLFLKNSSKFLVSIQSVSTRDIKYSPYGKMDQAITIDKSYVDRIVYADGNSLSFDVAIADEPVTPVASNNFYIDGQRDASRYYTGYQPASTGTLVVSLLSPLVGLIPAIACSSTPPKEKNLEYPNSQLFQNPDYKNGYTKEARKVKSRKVWKNWGIAFGVNIILAIMLTNS